MNEYNQLQWNILEMYLALYCARKCVWVYRQKYSMQLAECNGLCLLSGL